MWQIDYYNEKVQNEIMGWPEDLLARYIRITDLMEEYGPNLGMPFTRTLGDKLFEIRVKAKEGIGRAFFCYFDFRKIIILHGFIKKTQKTPWNDLRVAKKRIKEVLKNEL